MDEREKALTLREALRVLGIGSNPGSALVRHGVLPAQVTPSVTLIWQGDLDRFRSRYMLFKEISALVERPSAPATKIVLDGLGIRPAKVAPELDVSIYERRVVEEAVAAWKADPTLLKPVQRRITAKLPACDVRDRLGCNDSLVKRMIAEGLLEASVGPREVEVREPALDEYPASDASHVADDVDAERREQGTGCLGASCCVVVARHHRRRHGRPRAVEGHQLCRRTGAWNRRMGSGRHRRPRRRSSRRPPARPRSGRRAPGPRGARRRGRVPSGPVRCANRPCVGAAAFRLLQSVNGLDYDLIGPCSGQRQRRTVPGALERRIGVNVGYGDGR